MCATCCLFYAFLFIHFIEQRFIFNVTNFDKWKGSIDLEPVYGTAEKAFLVTMLVVTSVSIVIVFGLVSFAPRNIWNCRWQPVIVLSTLTYLFVLAFDIYSRIS